MIRVNAAADEVPEAKIRQGLSTNTDGSIGWDAGQALACHEVANLIVGGDTVFVIGPDRPGSYRKTNNVQVKPGQPAYPERYRGGRWLR